jgi:Spx/MgsR family transcriptional regulator
MYGIPNCDTVKKAMNWLHKNKILFEFHDYKKEGITSSKLKSWCKFKNWEIIFNKRSSTWKEVMASQEGIVNNQAEAIQIMTHHTSIIKRPILEMNDDIIVGFDEKEYLEKINKFLTQKNK